MTNHDGPLMSVLLIFLSFPVVLAAWGGPQMGWDGMRIGMDEALFVVGKTESGDSNDEPMRTGCLRGRLLQGMTNGGSERSFDNYWLFLSIR